MRELAIVQTNNFRQFSNYNGLNVLDIGDGGNLVMQLPPVKVVHQGKIGILSPMQLHNFGRIVAHLDEAIVRGRRLSTIWKSMLLPTGYAHSLNWLQEGGFHVSPDRMRCLWPATRVIDLSSDVATCLLGITSHFGHFFTDCLDRILAFERCGMTEKVRYLVDGAPPPQISELLALLGTPLTQSNMVALNPDFDYRVNNLRIASLGGSKPAVTIASFQNLRERVLTRCVNSHPSGRMIYVGRKLVPRRNVVNQHELDETLVTMGFSTFYPEMHSMQQSVGAFHGADVIALVIGSSKFNVAFCRPGTKIICIAPEGYVENSGPVATMLRQLCEIFRLELCFCSSKIAGQNQAINSDIHIGHSELELALEVLGAK